MKMTKKSIISIATVGIVAIAGVSIYLYSNFKTNQEIKECKDEIIMFSNKFDDEPSTDGKIDVLQSLNKYFNDYQKDHQVEELNDDFNNEVSEMKNYFKDLYENEIKTNTINNLEKVTDIKTIDQKSKNLNMTLINIKDKKDIVFSEEEIKNYTEQINKLVESYSKRIKAIEKANEKSKDNKQITKNTLKDVSKINDKDKLNKNTKTLQTLLKTISAKTKIYTEKEIKEYTTKINKLIKVNNDRIKAIEKAEKEAEAKAEQERQQQQQSQQSYNNYNNSSNGNYNNYNQGSYNNNNNYSGGSTGSNSTSGNSNNNTNNSNNNNNNTQSNSGSSNNGYLGSTTDQDGRTSYFNDDGTAWDSEGHTWNWKDVLNS